MKKAFTMLELVFTIIVLGILASMTLKRIDRDINQEAADNILSAIRYTQHLALIDDKHNYKSTEWYKTLWMIRFEQFGNDWIYKIATNIDENTNLDKNESAIDPLNGKYIWSSDATEDIDESPNIFLTQKYNITNIQFNDCKGQSNTDAKHIAFDHLGRVYRGILSNTSSMNGGTNDPLSKYVSNKNCEIDFIFNNDNNNKMTIIIERETGYSYIKNQPDS